LPFLTIAPTGDIRLIDGALTQSADRSLSVFLRNGVKTREFHIVGVEKMMAFDCGSFELK
jgi:hypothetical protein